MSPNRIARLGLVFALLGLTGCSWFGASNRHAPAPQAAAPLPDVSTAVPPGTPIDDRLNAVQAQLDELKTMQQEQQILLQQRQEIQQLQQMQGAQQQQIQMMMQQQNGQAGAAGTAAPNTATASAAQPQKKSGGITAYAPAFGWWEPGDAKNPSDYDKWDDESSREGNGDSRNY